MNLHDLTVRDLMGQEVPLANYKGKVLMIVNTASKCGYTPQLGKLQTLYDQYKDEGFEVLAFPSNQFGGQEPLEGGDIQSFCEINYDVKFTIFEKMDVKGDNQSELYQYLSKKRLNGRLNSTPRWNFHKYLIDKDGNVSDYFYTFTDPESHRVKRKIEKLLQA